MLTDLVFLGAQGAARCEGAVIGTPPSDPTIAGAWSDPSDGTIICFTDLRPAFLLMAIGLKWIITQPKIGT
jgi:hypothetical protein